jgi:hypothetical protein
MPAGPAGRTGHVRVAEKGDPAECCLDDEREVRWCAQCNTASVQREEGNGGEGRTRGTEREMEGGRQRLE